MDCHEILKLLMNFDENIENNIHEDELKAILDRAYSFIGKDFLNEITQNQSTISSIKSIGWQYLHLILYTISTFCNHELTKENPLITVDQFKVVQIAIDVSTSIGIVPQLKVHVTKAHPRTFKLKHVDNILENYKILTYTVNTLLDCFDQIILRPALIPQLNCLLAALLQLSHAPLQKPTENIGSCFSTAEFNMTIELHTKLKEEQQNFHKKLHELMINCPESLLIKELMVLMSSKNNPKWLQANIKSYLIDKIMSTNGIAALTLAICNDVSDLGECWHKLDLTAQLVATSHGKNIELYYDSICPQIIKMLNVKNNKQGIAIANCFIKALYDYKPEICINKIIHVIMEPLLVKQIKQKDSNVLKTENEITQCIEDLSKLFITMDAEFKCLPKKLLTSIALPLFYLHLQASKSLYIHRNQVRQLLLQILADESKREICYSIFLNIQEPTNDEFGEKLCFQFGADGGFQVSSEINSIEQEELVDCVFNLVINDASLSFNLFIYLLKLLPELSKLSEESQQGTLLEDDSDIMKRIEKQLSIMKLLTLLSDSSQVQNEQMKNPTPLLNCIKFFFTKINSTYVNCNTYTYEQDVSTLYTGLMLVKVMLTDTNFKHDWKIFENFIASIKQQSKSIPTHITSLIKEIEIIVKRKGKNRCTKNYSDLSVDTKNISEFDKAISDLADPLLPVRAHGIITLTKLIENRHTIVSTKKDFLLHMFQGNLNHEDSFIYLAAINGICALSLTFPEKVISILVHEFIGMSEGTRNHDVAPETRAKLGEILVKTTRGLGEITPKYKNILVNGFLTGTRDPDPLVRSSSLSCLGEFCKIMSFKLGNLIIEILYCIGCIIKTDKDDSCRRAGVLVATLLLRGLGRDTLTQLGENLVTLYRSLKHLRDNDKDPVLQLHAQLALEEFDDVVQQFLFAKPKLEKSIFLLQN